MASLLGVPHSECQGASSQHSIMFSLWVGPKAEGQFHSKHNRDQPRLVICLGPFFHGISCFIFKRRDFHLQTLKCELKIYVDLTLGMLGQYVPIEISRKGQYHQSQIISLFLKHKII